MWLVPFDAELDLIYAYVHHCTDETNDEGCRTKTSIGYAHKTKVLKDVCVHEDRGLFHNDL
jgi:hypothetical protein